MINFSHSLLDEQCCISATYNRACDQIERSRTFGLSIRFGDLFCNAIEGRHDIARRYDCIADASESCCYQKRKDTHFSKRIDVEYDNELFVSSCEFEGFIGKSTGAVKAKAEFEAFI
jgi:hypothetical protein